MPHIVLLFNNLDTTAINVGFYGVVEQAKTWWANPDQSFGLMIEPSRNYMEQYLDSKCPESLEDLSLTRYRVNEIKWSLP